MRHDQSMTSDQLARFVAKLSFEERDEDLGECWIWTAAKMKSGYAKLGIGGHAGGWALAHRMSYEHFVGPIPEGKEIDHLCRSKSCVNPRHLEPVTKSINSRRGVSPLHMSVVGRSWKGRKKNRTPEHAAALRAAMATPEVCAKRIAGIRAAWARRKTERAA